jgi:hypothetical protein
MVFLIAPAQTALQRLHQIVITFRCVDGERLAKLLDSLNHSLVQAVSRHMAEAVVVLQVQQTLGRAGRQRGNPVIRSGSTTLAIIAKICKNRTEFSLSWAARNPSVNAS